MKQLKNIIATIFILGGIILGYVIPGWYLFINPVLEVCKAFDAHNLTLTLTTISVIKVLFATPVKNLIITITSTIGGFIGTDDYLLVNIINESIAELLQEYMSDCTDEYTYLDNNKDLENNEENKE